MPKILSDAALAQYERDGYYFPIPVLDEAFPPRRKQFRSILIG